MASVPYDVGPGKSNRCLRIIRKAESFLKFLRRETSLLLRSSTEEMKGAAGVFGSGLGPSECDYGFLKAALCLCWNNSSRK